MAKNDFLARQNAAKQACLDIGETMGMQKMWDYVQIALTEPEVMSTHVLNKARMEKVFKRVGELADEYKVAFEDDKEADYYQEKLDKILSDIWETDLYPFYERYPYLRQFDYTKPKKDWR